MPIISKTRYFIKQSLLSEAVADNNINKAAKLLGKNKELAIDLAELDPTIDKTYLQWIVKMYKLKSFVYPEDNERIRRALDFFMNNKKKSTWKFHKDLNLYEKFQDLEDDIDKLRGIDLKKNRKQIKSEYPGSEVIYDDKLYKVIRSFKKEALEYFSKDTRWCTKKEIGGAEGYLHDSDVYLMSKSDFKLYQFDFGKVFSVQNVLDKPAAESLTEREKNILKELKDVFEKHKHNPSGFIQFLIFIGNEEGVNSYVEDKLGGINFEHQYKNDSANFLQKVRDLYGVIGNKNKLLNKIIDHVLNDITSNIDTSTPFEIIEKVSLAYDVVKVINDNLESYYINAAKNLTNDEQFSKDPLNNFYKIQDSKIYNNIFRNKKLFSQISNNIIKRRIDEIVENNSSPLDNLKHLNDLKSIIYRLKNEITDEKEFETFISKNSIDNFNKLLKDEDFKNNTIYNLNLLFNSSLTSYFRNSRYFENVKKIAAKNIIKSLKKSLDTSTEDNVYEKLKDIFSFSSAYQIARYVVKELPEYHERLKNDIKEYILENFFIERGDNSPYTTLKLRNRKILSNIKIFIDNDIIARDIIKEKDKNSFIASIINQKSQYFYNAEEARKLTKTQNLRSLWPSEMYNFFVALKDKGVKGPVPELENQIKNNAFGLGCYSLINTKEYMMKYIPIIARSHSGSYVMSMNYKERFPALEKKITEGTYVQIYSYAKNVLKHRFKEGEEKLFTAYDSNFINAIKYIELFRNEFTDEEFKSIHSMMKQNLQNMHIYDSKERASFTSRLQNMKENKMNISKIRSNIRKKIEEMAVEYDPNRPERMDPSVQNKIEKHKTLYGKHPSFPEKTGKSTQHFAELVASENFKKVVEKIKKYSGNDEIKDVRDLINSLIKIVLEIIDIESGHEQELEQLAVKVAKQDWRIKDEIDFDVEIVKRQTVKSPQEMQFQQPEIEDTIEDIASYNEEVAKRRFINGLIQGSANRGQYIFHMVEDELTKIHPFLPNLYGLVQSIGDLGYWIFPDVSSNEEGEEQDPAGWVKVDTSGTKPKIIARAVNFVLLLQEIIKGIMELMSLHGLPKDPKIQQSVLSKADFVAAETWDIRFGPGLWDRFVEAIGLDDYEVKAYLFARVVEMPAKEFNEFMKQLMAKDPKGIQKLKELAVKIKEDLKRYDAEDAVEKGREELKDLPDDDLNDFDISQLTDLLKENKKVNISQIRANIKESLLCEDVDNDNLNKAMEIQEIRKTAVPQQQFVKSLDNFVKKLILKHTIVENNVISFFKYYIGRKHGIKEEEGIILTNYYNKSFSDSIYFDEQINIYKEYIKELHSKIFNFAKKLGYFVGKIELEETYSSYTFLKYQSDKQLDLSKHKYLYHDTDNRNVKSILKKGLIPSRKGYYWDRFYGPSVFVSVFGETHLASHVQSANIKLKIDTTKLKKGTKFFRDFYMGWYTYSHIPPEAISVCNDEERCAVNNASTDREEEYDINNEEEYLSGNVNEINLRKIGATAALGASLLGIPGDVSTIREPDTTIEQPIKKQIKVNHINTKPTQSYAGNYNADTIKQVIEMSLKHNVDPQIALAVALCESNFGQRHSNIFQATAHDDHTIEGGIKWLKMSMDKLKNASLAKKLQIYNGIGKIKLKSGQIVDTRKNPIYGKKIIRLRNNAIRKSPELLQFLDTVKQNYENKIRKR